MQLDQGGRVVTFAGQLGGHGVHQVHRAGFGRQHAAQGRPGARQSGIRDHRCMHQAQQLASHVGTAYQGAREQQALMSGGLVGRQDVIIGHGTSRRLFCSLAPRQYGIEGVGLAPVDGQAVLLADRDHRLGEPAAVELRQPLGSVPRNLLVAVQAGRGKRQVIEVAGETRAHRQAGAAQSGVVRFRHGNDVLDVGFLETLEAGAVVG